MWRSTFEIGVKQLCSVTETTRKSTFLGVNRSPSGGSRILLRRGCTRLLLYFNTNKPHRFFCFFWQNTSCIRKPQVISGGVRTPCTLPLDPPLSPHPRRPWGFPGAVSQDDTIALYGRVFMSTQKLSRRVWTRTFFIMAAYEYILLYVWQLTPFWPRLKVRGFFIVFGTR